MSFTLVFPSDCCCCCFFHTICHNLSLLGWTLSHSFSLSLFPSPGSGIWVWTLVSYGVRPLSLDVWGHEIIYSSAGSFTTTQRCEKAWPVTFVYELWEGWNVNRRKGERGVIQWQFILLHPFILTLGMHILNNLSCQQERKRAWVLRWRASHARFVSLPLSITWFWNQTSTNHCWLKAMHFLLDKVKKVATTISIFRIS